VLPAVSLKETRVVMKLCLFCTTYL